MTSSSSGTQALPVNGAGARGADTAGSKAGDSAVREGQHPDFCPPVEEGITLVFQDESGDTVSLEFLGMVVLDDREFGFFFPVDEDHPALSSGEVIVLEVLETDDEGIPESFELVEDELLAQTAYEKFQEATAGLYRFE